VAAAEPVVLPRPAERARSLWRTLWELLHDLAAAAVFCFFVITFVAQPFRVQGLSMLPLLEDGQRIVVNKLVYRLRRIERGEVVVFHYPRDPSISFIKRVVGVPGDVVEIREGVVYVNRHPLREAYVTARFRDLETHPPVEVSRGYYYVLGDHRNSSHDSRNWGLVPERYIYGRASFRFWPPSRLRFIR
jgi:signal peptidase I